METTGDALFTSAVHPSLSLSSTLSFLSGKHHCLIIALLPYAPSCCCFIAFLSCRGFNKALYLFVSTQASLALTAVLFNFLTGYLLEEEGKRRRAGLHEKRTDLLLQSCRMMASQQRNRQINTRRVSENIFTSEDDVAPSSIIV